MIPVRKWYKIIRGSMIPVQKWCEIIRERGENIWELVLYGSMPNYSTRCRASPQASDFKFHIILLLFACSRVAMAILCVYD
jgi:hypothetical protein